MDTRKKTPAEVEQDLQRIKSHMPETYKAIQAEAARIGNAAFATVRRGCAGQPNCFWAMEGGYVVGTPFSQSEIQRDVAQHMVSFGCAYACIFQDLHQGQLDGTN